MNPIARSTQTTKRVAGAPRRHSLNTRASEPPPAVAVAFVGMALWGLNKGAQDTLLKPAITPLIPPARRSTAFGIFDTGFGVAWPAGSVAFGLLYDRSLPVLVTVSVVAQLLSLPLFVLGRHASRHSRG